MFERFVWSLVVRFSHVLSCSLMFCFPLLDSTRLDSKRRFETNRRHRAHAAPSLCILPQLNKDDVKVSEEDSSKPSSDSRCWFTLLVYTSEIAPCKTMQNHAKEHY